MSLMLRRSLSTCMRLYQSGGKPVNRFQSQYGNKSAPSTSSTSRNTKNSQQGRNNRPPPNGQQGRNNRSSPNGQQGRNSKPSPNGKRNQQRDQIRVIDPRKFEFKEGSETAKSAITSLISKIHLQSPDFIVEQVTKSGLRKVHLSQIFTNLNLSNEGIQVIERNDEELPLIKVVPVQEMNSWYTDLLTKVKLMELLKLGSAKTMKTLEIKLKQEQKKSTTKELLLKWNISLNDLKNQKKLEIEKIVKNGKQKVFLINIVYGKTQPGRSISSIYNDPEDLEIEMKKREMLKNILEEEILNSLDCKWTVEGDLETKLNYHVTLKQTQQSTDSTVQTQTPQQKKEKKIKQLHEQQVKPKPKASDEDLDNLYLFKIED